MCQLVALGAFHPHLQGVLPPGQLAEIQQVTKTHLRRLEVGHRLVHILAVQAVFGVAQRHPVEVDANLLPRCQALQPALDGHHAVGITVKVLAEMRQPLRLQVFGRWLHLRKILELGAQCPVQRLHAAVTLAQPTLKITHYGRAVIGDADVVKAPHAGRKIIVKMVQLARQGEGDDFVARGLGQTPVPLAHLGQGFLPLLVDAQPRLVAQGDGGNLALEVFFYRRRLVGKPGQGVCRYRRLCGGACKVVGKQVNDHRAVDSAQRRRQKTKGVEFALRGLLQQVDAHGVTHLHRPFGAAGLQRVQGVGQLFHSGIIALGTEGQCLLQFGRRLASLAVALAFDHGGNDERCWRRSLHQTGRRDCKKSQGGAQRAQTKWRSIHGSGAQRMEIRRPGNAQPPIGAAV